MEQSEVKRCPVCRIGGYKKYGQVDYGLCFQCRDVMTSDMHLVYRCAEVMAEKYGHMLEDVYAENRKQQGVTGRRLLAATMAQLTHCTSYDIMNLFQLRGKELNDSSIRHLILSARDFYSVSKSYKTVLDSFLSDVVDQYMLQENMVKKSSLLGIEKISNILVNRGMTDDPATATDVALEILNAVR